MNQTFGEDHGPEERSWPADRGWHRDSSSGHNAGWQVDKVTGRDDCTQGQDA